MCGIIGVTGSSAPRALLIEGLQLLEYRGYDSAGVAIVTDGGLRQVRAAERAKSITALAGELAGEAEGEHAAIGHTRWATHGAPTEQNAHPHLDCTGRVAVVHNGIIENHRELAAELVASGHHLASETDSEVVAHLVEAARASGLDLFSAVAAVAPRLRGGYALCFVDADEPDTLVATRRGAPIVMGIGEGTGYVASDLAALVGHTRELFQLQDDEVVRITPSSLEVIDVAGRRVEPQRVQVLWDVAAAQKGGYADFMEKEIHEQPAAIRETLRGRVSGSGRVEFEELELDEALLREAPRVLFVACGSSYHAALTGRAWMEQVAKLPAEVEIASEFRYREAVLAPGTLVVAISQSGETADTREAMAEARRAGATCIALTNVVDSLMSREADGVLYTHAGPEIGVASTKCHLAQISLLQAFALHLGSLRGSLPAERAASLAQSLGELPALVESAIAREAEYRRVAGELAMVEDFYFLGRRLGLPIALEGALKLKELAYVRAEGYPAGEMKHGPISLIEPGAVVVVPLGRTPLWEKVMLNVEEMRARGATIVGICDEGDEESISSVDMAFVVPAAAELVSVAPSIVPLQFLAHEIATRRGNDVDRPRNLAKVVTVE